MNHLQDQAMLVNLTVSQWTASKKDPGVSKAVQQQHGASEKKAGWFNKRLIDPAALEEIGRIEGRIRSFHYTNTMPWGDNGDRLLPSKLYMDYVDGLRKLRGTFDTAVSEFVARYPQLVQDARAMLGTMYNPGDYPDPHRIAHRFGVTSSFLPIPDAEDFRAEVGEQAVEEIKASIMAGVVERQARALDECWTRLYEVVLRIYERMSDPEVVFRASLFENARDLVELLPKMNITDDANLEAAIGMVRTLAAVNPDRVRASTALRSTTADAAQVILRTIEGWVPNTKTQ